LASRSDQGRRALAPAYTGTWCGWGGLTVGATLGAVLIYGAAVIAAPPPKGPARPALVALSLLALVALPRLARAAGADAIVSGERYGAILPDGVTAVRVDREELAFALARDLGSAAVTAAFQLTNTGAAAESADLAFVYSRTDRDEDDPAARIALEADGAPLRFRAATDAELLAPRVRAWVDAHAEVDRALAAFAGAGDPAGPGVIRSVVEAAGGHCDAGQDAGDRAGAGGCAGLVAWYRSSHNEEEHRLTGVDEDDDLVDAAREVAPGALAAVARGWPVDARLGFLLFRVDFLPGQTRSVTAHYQHRAEVDRRAHANDTLGFDYWLSPAVRWAGFGPIDVSVRVPGRAVLASPLPFRREGDTYRSELPGLPDGELRFQAMSLDGLWLGMTRPHGYWAILAGAMAATAFAVGGAMARRRPGAPRWKRALLPLVTGGPLAAACNLAVLVLFLAAFPVNALGAGYGGLVRGALLVALSVPAGAMASVLWAGHRNRRVE